MVKMLIVTIMVARASEEAGVSLTGKACDEWTKGYDTGFNVTCAFTPNSINDYCNGDNQTFPGYIHNLGSYMVRNIRQVGRMIRMIAVKNIHMVDLEERIQSC
jgi:hypothetical protein